MPNFSFDCRWHAATGSTGICPKAEPHCHWPLVLSKLFSTAGRSTAAATAAASRRHRGAVCRERRKRLRGDGSTSATGLQRDSTICRHFPASVFWRRRNNNHFLAIGRFSRLCCCYRRRRWRCFSSNDSQ